MDKKQAKKRIRTAMLELVDDRRFSAITVGDVIRTAGVNRSTFYYHYTDKYALRDDIIDEMLGHLQRSIPLHSGGNQFPEPPDIAADIELIHAQKDLFLRFTNPNWEVDTRTMAQACFASVALEWAKAQPMQGFAPELFADLYAASALMTVLYSFKNGVDAETIAGMISDHFQRGFFRAFIEPDDPSRQM